MTRTQTVGLLAAAVTALTLSAPGVGAARTTGPDTTHDAAVAASGRYVAMGDSFAAGSGVLPLAPGSPPMCARSASDAAHLVAAERDYALTDVTCGGAATTDFSTPQFPGVAPQFDAVTPDVDLVTIMVGGNDGDVFGTAVGQCTALGVLPHAGDSPCRDRWGDTLLDTVRTRTAPALVDAFRTVRARAPHARVVVIGYPRLLPETGSCPDRLPVAAGDLPFLDRLQTTLGSAVRDAAHTTGVEYADMSERSRGHDLCAPVGERWIEPLLGSQHPVPVHPNAAGLRAMADAVLEVLDR